MAEGAGEKIEVFVLFFLCRKDLEHGSGGGGGGEDCGVRTAVKVVEDGGEREVGECGEDRETRVEYKYSLRLLCEILRLLLNEALLFQGEALRLLHGEALRLLHDEALRLLHGEALRLLHGEALRLLHDEALRLLHDEALRLLHDEALRLQNGTTALLLTGAVVLLCYGDVTVQLLCCGGCFNKSLHSFQICIILTKKNTCILNNNYF